MGPFYSYIFSTPCTILSFFRFIVPVEHVSFWHLPQIIQNGSIFLRYFMSFWLFESLKANPKNQAYAYVKHRKSRNINTLATRIGVQAFLPCMIATLDPKNWKSYIQIRQCSCSSKAFFVSVFSMWRLWPRKWKW